MSLINLDPLDESPVVKACASATPTTCTPDLSSGTPSSENSKKADVAGLANLYHEAALQKLQQGEFREAIGFLRKALAVSKREIGAPDSPGAEVEACEDSGSTDSGSPKISEVDTAQTAFILGMIQLNQLSDLNGAEESLRFALALRRRALGEGASATIVTKGAVAQALERQEKLDEATALYEEGVEQALAVLGDAHLNTAFALAQLGSCLLKREQAARAVEMFRRSLEVHVRGRTGRAHELRTALLVLNAIGVAGGCEEERGAILQTYGEEAAIRSEMDILRQEDLAAENWVAQKASSSGVAQQTMG